MKEIELVDKFCKFLDRKNWKYKRELWKGDKINEGYFDVVILKDNVFVGVEAKVNNFKGVLMQAWINTLYFPLSYILYPDFPSSRNIKELKKTKIGFIIPRGDGFRVVRKPKLNKTCLQEIIVRNWVENRIGRKFHETEIPEEYNMENIKDLECSYDWLLSKFELDLKKKIQKQLNHFWDLIV